VLLLHSAEKCSPARKHCGLRDPVRSGRHPVDSFLEKLGYDGVNYGLFTMISSSRGSRPSRAVAEN